MEAVFRAVATALLMGAVSLQAGDILRGGATTSRSANGRGGGSTINSEAAAAASRQNARDRLARTTEAVTAMRSLQAQARSSAAGANNLGMNPNRPGVPLPDVPDGLVPGGLDILGTPTGALAPRQSGGAGGANVIVQQTESQALLNWKTFNVGKKTVLQFDQSAGGVDAGKWIAFNRVTDPSGAPSQILGSIKSDGQVYVINQNGIIFGGASQINTRSLVASSLPINDNLITRGLLNNPDAQFLFSALPVPAGSKGPTLEFTPPAALTPTGRSGDVVVQKGAVLSAPTTAEKVGGRITLIGPNVLNEGTISTPDGQTILAAGLQVGFAAHPSGDPSLRGLDVFVGAVEYPGGDRPPIGTAINRGLIEIPRANVTIMGKLVQQMGVIDGVTSIALNGRVDLAADYGAVGNTRYDATNPSLGPIFDNRASGVVELGPGSVIRILPEAGETETTVGTALSLPSLASIQGQAIHFAENSILLAPGASLPSGSNAITPVDASGAALSAGVSINAGLWLSASAINAGQRRFTGGQIYLDAGALIDVAGSVDVAAPIENYLLTVQLRGAELAGSPLQRTSTVRGQSLTVDLRKTGVYNGSSWVGTPLGDVSGYVGLIQRNAAQLTTAGGSVNLNAGESVVMQPGSQIDVSGGWLNLAGGKVRTTRLLEKGRLINIEDATPDRVYDGIYDAKLSRTHAKWGITETFVAALAPTGEYVQKDHMQGANAGSLAINAPSVALDGKLTGQAVQGPRQASPTTLDLAKGGSLSLTFKATEVLTPFDSFSPTPPQIIFGTDLKLPAARAFGLTVDGGPQELRAERKEKVILSPSLLTESGFGTLVVDNSDGSISVPEGVELKAPLKGSVTLKAAKMDIEGKITAPGGSIDLAVYDFSPYARAKLVPGVSVAPTQDLTRGVFSLGPKAELNTAGLITDYRPGSAGPADQPPLVDGGSVTINAYTAILAPGSEIDVSGGVSSGFTGERTYGAAGSIAINAGREPDLSVLVGGKLFLGSTLKGFSGVQGGSLNITAPLIQIGGQIPTLIPPQDLSEGFYRFGNADVFPGEVLFLSPEFFSQGGFTSFTLRGLGKLVPGLPGVTSLIPKIDEYVPAINIAPGTVIRPVALSQRVSPRPGARALSLEPYLKPDGLREPVSLAFLAPTTQDIFAQPAQNILRGDIVMGEGAVIETEPLGNVTFEGSTVSILGTVIAPGGNIIVRGANVFPLTIPSAPPVELDQALPTVQLGPRSVLSAAGRVVLTPDSYGRRVGSVLPGGTITVSGNIVAQAGALLDVSGASGVFDLHPDSLVANLDAPRLVPPNSGLNSTPYSLRTVPVQVDSDAGTIALRGGQELFTEATLRGFAGGPSARGGTLEISSGRYVSPLGTTATSPLDINLIVTQTGRTIPGDYPRNGEKVIGNPVPLPLTLVPGEELLGRGRFAVSDFVQGGFDSLKLSGVGQTSGAVQFSGPVSIRARRSLSISEGGVIYADADVSLQAPYVKLGTPFAEPLLATQLTNLTNGGVYFPPTFGPGHLTVRGSLIDIGNLSLQNIGRATFIAEDGDIRGNGTLNVAGEIEFRAGQIYPTTASRFTIVAYDPNITVATSAVNSNQVTLASAVLPPGFGVGAPLLGSTVTAINGAVVTLAANANTTIGAPTPVTFAPGQGSVTIAAAGERPLPLSAGGVLSIYGSNITQGGTLRAPLGTINLGWDGVGASPVDYATGAGLVAGRSVPVTRQLTLAGGSITSVSAVDPRTGEGIIIPYGFNSDGTTWIDPTGVNITAGLVPQKAVNLSAEILSDQAGSLIDVRGGGDLFAPRFVVGNSGPSDILGTPAAGWLTSENYSAGDLVSY
ncbi:MAG: filamentous hemagglutinin N-terminal domain-containing protein, partial [Terrimicrobiaceae bacterium]